MVRNTSTLGANGNTVCANPGIKHDLVNPDPVNHPTFSTGSFLLVTCTASPGTGSGVVSGTPRHPGAARRALHGDVQDHRRRGQRRGQYVCGSGSVNRVVARGRVRYDVDPGGPPPTSGPWSPRSSPGPSTADRVPAPGPGPARTFVRTPCGPIWRLVDSGTSEHPLRVHWAPATVWSPVTLGGEYVLKHLRSTDDWNEKSVGAKGFTLIELLVVIVILGILAAVVVFAVGGITDKGQDSACKSEAQHRPDGHRVVTPPRDNNSYPTGVTDLTTNNAYLSKAPDGPGHLHRWASRRRPGLGLQVPASAASHALTQPRDR